MSNLDRRKILDDISGISKFDEEISKAQGERNEAESNIERVSIILSELVKQIEQLEQDKEVALTYLRMKEMLTQSKAQMAYKRKEATEAEIQALQKQIDTYVQDIELMKVRKAEIAQTVKALDDQMVLLDKELGSKGGQEFKELRDKIDLMKVQVAKAEDRAAQAMQSASEMEVELAQRTNDQKENEGSVKGLSKELENISARYGEISKALASDKKELAEVRTKLSASDEQLSSVQKKLASDERATRDNEEKYHRLQMEKERLEDRRSRAMADVSSYEEELKAAEFGVQDIEWKIKGNKGPG